MTIVISQAGRSVVPSSPPGTSLPAPADPIQLHAEGAQRAGHGAALPAPTIGPECAGAKRKAVQALAALRRLDVMGRA